LLVWDGLLWDLRGQSAKLIDCLMDLALRLSALPCVQLNGAAGQATSGSTRNRDDHFQIAIDRFHGR
jgi:hypothetical protein